MLQELDTAIAFVVLMLMLSLLVTAIVQAISALLDLRGKNLVRSLADLLKQIDAGLRAAPGEVGLMEKIKNWLAHPFSRITLATMAADAVATHPILAHTFARAKAIRQDELLDVLKDLCSDAPAGKVDPVVQTKLKEILAAQVPGAQDTVDTALALADVLALKFPGIKDDVKNAVVQTAGKVSRLEAGIEKWFDTVMDRASDIFTRWTRVITIVVSVLLVVVLHVDSGLILHQISSNPEIRAGLNKISDTALAQADETLKAGDRATAALKAVAANHKGDAIESALNGAPPLVSCADGKKWLEDYAKKTNSDMGQLQLEFADSCQQQTVAALGKSEDQISKIRQELADTELKIVPERIEGQLVFGDKNDSVWSRIKSWAEAYRSPRHLLGTLAMVILLSLGAPFWYNMLSQLSNLRPGISTKIHNESAEA
jgi:hypothetical protein